jgi:hypothetical protein
MTELIVHHAYVRVGEPLPCRWVDILHISSREEGTGLDVWWYKPEDNR